MEIENLEALFMLLIYFEPGNEVTKVFKKAFHSFFVG